MVRAWFYDNIEGDQRLPHTGEAVSLETLGELGVFHTFIDPVNYHDGIEAVVTKRNYKNRDELWVSPEKLPNYEQKIKTFFEEHIHEDEEIRFILEGGGYFDVRDRQDRWIRVEVSPGDLLILPAGIYHRFTLDVNDFIHVIRLFKEDPKWTPINRSIPTTDSNPFRVDYVKLLEIGR